MAGSRQAGTDRFAVGAGRPAAEILNVETRHNPSLLNFLDRFVDWLELEGFLSK
jgi:hypothetical protein